MNRTPFKPFSSRAGASARACTSVSRLPSARALQSTPKAFRIKLSLLPAIAAAHFDGVRSSCNNDADSDTKHTALDHLEGDFMGSAIAHDDVISIVRSIQAKAILVNNLAHGGIQIYALPGLA